MYLIFDTETSGLPVWSAPVDYHLQPRIVQLAFVLLDSQFKERMSFCSLIESNGWTIEEGAQRVHGIDVEDCNKFGISIEDALSIFHASALKSEKVCAFNLKFDSLLIDIEMSKLQQSLYNWQNHGICAMLESTPVCKLPKSRGNGFKWPKLDEAFDFMFNEPRVNQHDALQDCRDTGRILKWLVQNGFIIERIPSVLSQL